MTTTKNRARPYLSGFCNPANPEESHLRCPLEYRGTPCSCFCHMAPLTPPNNRKPVAEGDPGSDRHSTALQGTPGGGDVAVSGDLLTPSGFLVTDAAPDTGEWFAARRGGITGTDLPKILGFSKYGNALSVWLDKRGEIEDEAGEAAFWGTILEDPVAQVWAERHNTTVQRVGVLANVELPWMRASLDRTVDTCPDGDGPCGLEVKTRSAFKSKVFRSEVPDDVLAQTTWGLMVTGFHHVHVAVLIGGQELRSFRVDRDRKIEDYLLDAGAPVWAAVGDGVPPEAHPDAEGVLLALLNKIYADRSGERDLDPEKARPWLEQYAAGHETEREGKAAKEQAKAALVQLVDDGDAGRVDGALVFTYKRPDPGDTLTAAKLSGLAKKDPTTYAALKKAGYVTTTNPGPRFDFKGEDA